jgi:hypothetical protein
MTIEVSTTDHRDGKALALFARHQDWQRGYTKDGRSFFAIPGSHAGLFHMADQNDCSCPDRQQSRNVCKHMRAVRLWFAAYKTGAVTPKSRPLTPTVADDAGIGDELVILTLTGAAFLAEQQQNTGRPLASDDEIEFMFAVVAECDRAARESRLAKIFGADDDKPYCTPCHRHHERGQHYTIVAR